MSWQTATSRKNELTEWIAEWVRRELRIDRGQIEGDRTFVAYGMDSVHATMMVGDLEELLRRRLPPTLAWDFPTLNALADFLAREAPPEQRAAPSNEKDADLLARLNELSEEEIDRLLKERLDSQRW